MNGLYPEDGGGNFSELAVLYVVIQKATFWACIDMKTSNILLLR